MIQTTSTPSYYVGVDVSKDKLDASCPAWGEVRTFPNCPAGLRSLLAGLAPGAHVVCEASGGYERGLAGACHRLGVAFSAVNPARPRDFARAAGLLAKTDAIDAGAIRAYAEALHPAPAPAPCPLRARLSAAVRRRDDLKRQLAAEKNALGSCADAFVRSDIRRAASSLARRVACLDSEITRLVRSEPALAEKRRRLEQVQGVGPVLSAVILAEMPELGSLSDNQAAALAGLAPFNRDSGRWRGTRTISGGRSLVRRSLFMPALCASSKNPVLAPLYRRLREKNKPHHVAITAVMRRLLCVLNRCLADPEFTPA